MNVKNEKGVTLIVLTITITVLLIITGITINISKGQLSVKDVNNLYSDIDSINTKVSAYYLENGELPVYSRQYADKETFKKCLAVNGAKGTVLNANDEGYYYVIDLSKLDNLTLNYGRQYKQWGSSQNATLGNFQDVYVINEITHQIYYPKGIKSNEKVYFTQDTGVLSVNKVDSLPVIDSGNSGFTITSSTKTRTTNSEGKIILNTAVKLNINNSNYLLNTLKYGYSATNDINTASFTSFTLDGNLGAILVSKPLDSSTNYYLFIKVLDINGNEHELTITI